MDKSTGRRGSLPYTCTALGLFLPVTGNIKQTWLCIAPAVLYTLVCSLCSSPGALDTISSTQVSGKGFLQLFCVHHGWDSSVTSPSCQHHS